MSQAFIHYWRVCSLFTNVSDGCGPENVKTHHMIEKAHAASDQIQAYGADYVSSVLVALEPAQISRSQPGRPLPIRDLPQSVEDARQWTRIGRTHSEHWPYGYCRGGNVVLCFLVSLL